jgi:hypothetical protein
VAIELGLRILAAGPATQTTVLLPALAVGANSTIRRNCAARAL